LEEINRRKNNIKVRNTDVQKDIALESKLGQETKRLMEFWGIIRKKR
jgi:hypothetical protein